jgi:hypothetical protein
MITDLAATVSPFSKRTSCASPRKSRATALEASLMRTPNF